MGVYFVTAGKRAAGCARYPDTRCDIMEPCGERGSKMFKRVWADLIEPVGEVVVVVKKGVVDGRTGRVRE